MSKKRVVAFVLSLAVTFSLILPNAIAAEGEGGGSSTTTPELTVEKTINWNPSTDREHASITVTSDVPHVNDTKVLFIGTRCTAHGMSDDTIKKSINAIAHNADVYYHLIDSDNNSGTEISGDVKRGDNNPFQKSYTVWNGSHHAALHHFIDVLDEELQSEDKFDYDYIVLEFDGSRIADRCNTDPNGTRGNDEKYNQYLSSYDNIANKLSKYYAANKVIWITDGFNASKSTSTNKVYGDTPYIPNNTFYYNKDTNKSVLTQKDFRALCSVFAPDYYLTHTDPAEKVKGSNNQYYYGNGSDYKAVDDSFRLKPGYKVDDPLYGDATGQAYASDSRQMYYNKAQELEQFLYMAIQGVTLKFTDKIQASNSDSLHVTSITVSATEDSNLATATWKSRPTFNVAAATPDPTKLDEDGHTYVEDDKGELRVTKGNTNAADNNLVTLNIVDLKNKLKFVKVVIELEDSEGFKSCTTLKLDKQGVPVLDDDNNYVYAMNPNDGFVEITAVENGTTIAGKGEAEAEAIDVGSCQVKGTVTNGTQAFTPADGRMKISGANDDFLSIVTYEDDSPVYTFTPTQGYEFDSIKIDGTTVSLDANGGATNNTTGSKYTISTNASTGVVTVKFPNISKNRTVDVKFLAEDPDLSITKTIASPTTTTVKGGAQITYNITVTNNAVLTVTGATITDTIDTTKVEFVSADNGGTYDAATKTVTWNNVSVSTTEPTVLSLTVKVLSTITGTPTLSNTAGGKYPNTTPIPTSAPVNKTLQGRDITVKYNVGGTVPTSYTTPSNTTVTYGNTLSSQQITTQNANTTIAGYTFDGWYLDSALTESFDPAAPFNSTNYPALANTSEVTLYGKWNSNKSFTVEKTVKYDQAAVQNNGYVPAGSTVTYTIKVTNNNTDVAIPNVVITDTLPDGLINISGYSGNASYSSATSNEAAKIVWTITIPAGKSVELTYNATIPSITTKTTYKNVAAVTSADGETILNTSDEVTVKGEPKYIPISVSKDWSDGWTSHAGETVEVQLYRKIATDTFYTEVRNPIVLSQTTSAATLSVPPYDDNGNEYEYKFLEVKSGQNTATVFNEGAMNGRYRVNYTITGSVTAIMNTYVLDGADFTLTKTANGTAVPGEPLTYTITVTNKRANEAGHNIVICDSLPNELEVEMNGSTPATDAFVPSIGSVVYDENLNNVTWTIASLAGGETATLTIKANVNATLEARQIQNTAYIDTVETKQYNSSEYPTVPVLTDVRVFEVFKTWSNPSETHDPVTVQLMQNGQAYTPTIGSGSVQLSDANQWTYKWTNLPMYDGSNQLYTYTVEETISVPGYVTTYYYGGANGNTYGSIMNTLKTYDISYQFVGTSQPSGITPPASTTVDWGTKYDSEDKPSDPSFVFDGWFTDPDCTIPYVDGTTIDDTTTSGGALILYGKWSEKVDVSYKFTGDVPADAKVPSSELLPPDTAYTADSKTKSTDTYAFDGWYTDMDCTKKYVDGTKISSDTVLYGKWSRKTTDITFGPGSGEGPNPDDVKYPDPTKGNRGDEYPMPADPVYEGDDYTFVGWYTDPECTTPYVPGPLTTETLKFYAKWTNNPVVRYSFVGETPDGVQVPGTDIVEPGTSYKTQSPVGTTTTYVFDGWYLDPACTQKFVEGTIITKDTMVYGMWRKIEEPIMPKTGDVSKTPNWVAFALIGGAAVLVWLVIENKRKNSTN